MTEAKRQLFWNDGDVDTLAVVNRNTATYISTDFMLGNYMSLEICFKRTSITDTWHVIAEFMPISLLSFNDFRTEQQQA